jgi:hypothetical protein
MVWGFCESGANVTILLDGGAPALDAKVSDYYGQSTWRVVLPATPYTFTPSTITARSISAAGTAAVTLGNVLFGDVW